MSWWCYRMGLLWLVVLLVVSPCLAQLDVRGTVIDASTGAPLPDVQVVLFPSQQGTYTDSAGGFRLRAKPTDSMFLRLELLGYEVLRLPLSPARAAHLALHLHRTQSEIQEVRIATSYRTAQQQNTGANVAILSHRELRTLRAASLAQSLEALPGMHSMQIGQGGSKPMIRGMGFNRVAVIDRGLKQEGQQWGADHALELDQMAAWRVAVYKGPMSLRYGGEAMGGAIVINEQLLRPPKGWHADLALWSETNAWRTGLSLGASYAATHYYCQLQGTAIGAGDYGIPTDTVNYLSWRLPIVRRQLKNTATRELDFTLDQGLHGPWGHLALSLSSVYMANGMFPGAHGIPSVARVQPDGCRFNIELPAAQVQHYKAILRYQSPHFGGCWQLRALLGGQLNLRQELSTFHTHYPDQPMPARDPDLELSFNLRTLSASVGLSWQIRPFLRLEAGLDAEYQRHTFAGYGFLLPNYQRASGGLFAIAYYQMSSHWKLEAGLRGDVAYTDITPYRDQYLATFLQKNAAYTPGQIDIFSQRVAGLKKLFYDYSWALGLVYTPSAHHELKFHAGQCFRLPTVNELAANGLHHGVLRHERGDLTLLSERGIQADVQYLLNAARLQLDISLFVAYYFRYIYLEPTGRWSILPHAGQVYQYRKAQALTGGGELRLRYALGWQVELQLLADAVLQHNLEDGYPLPFTPAPSLRGQVGYTCHGIPQRAGKLFFSVTPGYTLAQDRVSRNEEPTPGYFLLEANVTYSRQFHRGRMDLSLKGHNLTNRCYFNHLSYYRRLQIPEAGCAAELSLMLHF